MRGGVPVVSMMSASYRMASMVLAPKWAKGAAGAWFVRASARRLAASVAALTEDMAVMALLWWKNWTVWEMLFPRVSSI